MDAWIPGGIRQTREDFVKPELEVKAAARPPKFLHVAPDSVALGQYSNRALKQTVLPKGSSEKASSSSLPLGRRSYTAVTSCRGERWDAALCKLAFVNPPRAFGRSSISRHHTEGNKDAKRREKKVLNFKCVCRKPIQATSPSRPCRDGRSPKSLNPVFSPDDCVSKKHLCALALPERVKKKINKIKIIAHTFDDS